MFFFNCKISVLYLVITLLSCAISAIAEERLPLKDEKTEEKVILEETSIKKEDTIVEDSKEKKNIEPNTKSTKTIDSKDKRKDIFVDKKYVIENEKVEEQVITIKDGDRNINITFKPEILVKRQCENKCNNLNKKKNIKNASSNSKNVKKKKQYKKQPKKQYKKTTNVSKRETTGQYDKLSIRGIYEQNRNNNDINYLQEDSKVIRNINVKKQPKEEQPIYIINRIITIDDNIELTPDSIDKISNDTEGQVSYIDKNDGNTNKIFKNAYLSSKDIDIFDKYDAMQEDDLKFGEIAFIEERDN